ncbi:hypothetical protein [Deinococcus sp. UYEF24]
MNRNVLWGILGAVLVVILGFGGYYFAVAVPAKDRAELALKQQQIVAQLAQQKAAAQAQQAQAQAKQAEAQAKQQALEATQQQAQAAQDAKDKRSSYLAACQQKADSVYWNYVKLNGTPVDGQPGVYNAYQTVWDQARLQKQDKLDECFRLVDSGVNPDDLTATVVPTSVPDPAPASSTSLFTSGSSDSTSISDDDVQSFVQSYLAAGESSDLATSMNLYADSVSYFDQGVKPKSFLYSDKQGYFKRWPVRAYALDSGVTTLSDDGSTRQVRFDYTYRVERTGKVLAGRAYTILDLEKVGGELEITSERGKVY